MTQSLTNNATTTLAADMNATQTNMTVQSAAKFPASGSAPYTLLVDNEYMLVTAGMGTTAWTVTRGAEGSTPTTHNGTTTPATVQLELTAGVFAAMADGGLNSAWNFLRPSGLVGATTATRWVGGTSSGPPASGTFNTNDFIIDASGAVWVCTAGGSPGTWAGGAPTFAQPRLVYPGAFINTSSTTFVEVDPSLRATVTVPSTGVVAIRQCAIARVGTVPEDVFLGVQVDGTGATTLTAAFPLDQVNVDVPVSGETMLTGLTPGSHTFYMMWHSGVGNQVGIAANTRQAAAQGTYNMAITQP